MLSGVGPAEHLRQIGIAVAVDQPRIGANLHDHLLTRIYFRSRDKMPPLADTGVGGTTYLKTRASLAGPDIQILGRQNAIGSQDLKPDEGYNILPGLMKPVSRGTVRLASADENHRMRLRRSGLVSPIPRETEAANIVRRAG